MHNPTHSKKWNRYNKVTHTKLILKLKKKRGNQLWESDVIYVLFLLMPYVYMAARRQKSSTY